MKKTILMLSVLVAVAAMGSHSALADHDLSSNSKPAAVKLETGCTFHRELQVGMRGVDVVCLQNYLKTEAVFSRAVVSTGYFGPITKEAVRKWQEKHAQAQSGMFSASDVRAYAVKMGYIKEEHKEDTHMEHPKTDVSHLSPKMSLNLEVLKDLMSGWNVKLNTTGFKFTPENASKAPVLGEGHGHIMVDDVKLARVYGSWFHVPKQPNGQHVIHVTLNGNDHSEYVVDGKSVEAKYVISEE